MRLQLIGSFEKEEAYRKAMMEPEKYVEIFTKDEDDTYDPTVAGVEIPDSELTRNGNFLYIDEDRMQKYLFFKGNRGFKLYRILPRVTESNIFHWKERWANKKAPGSRSIWAKVSTPYLEFGICYHLYDGSANISAGESIGSNATFHTVVPNATNETILEVINGRILDAMTKASKMEILRENTAIN